MQIALTPAQFETLKQKLSGNLLVHVSPTSYTSGAVADSEATLSYDYDGAAFLTITVVAKHGLARFAPESEVEAKINQLVQENL
jgi:hypothetical protein